MIVDVTLAGPAILSASVSERASVTQQEFEAFHRETARPLWRYLARICGDRALAEDLSQEAYLRFCRARIPRAREEWKAYLYRIATNLAADWWRHAGRRIATGADPHATADPAVADAEAAAIRRRELDRALALLKPRERALLWLAYVEGWDHRAIARSLDLSRASVKVLLFRARRKVGETLLERGIGPEVLS